MPLFTHEVEPSRRLMTTQARHPLRDIDDVVSPIFDLGACLRDIQKEKLPAVRFGRVRSDQTLLRVDFENNAEARLTAHHPAIGGLGFFERKNLVHRSTPDRPADPPTHGVKIARRITIKGIDKSRG